jgi:hypothetical protein
MNLALETGRRFCRFVYECLYLFEVAFSTGYDGCPGRKNRIEAGRYLLRINGMLEFKRHILAFGGDAIRGGRGGADFHDWAESLGVDSPDSGSSDGPPEHLLKFSRRKESQAALF